MTDELYRPYDRVRFDRPDDGVLLITLDDPDRWLQSGGAEFRYEAQATWTLDRLIFADDEIAIERLREQAAKAERDRGIAGEHARRTRRRRRGAP